MESIATVAYNEFLKTLSYPMSLTVMSKTMLAAVNPESVPQQD